MKLRWTNKVIPTESTFRKFGVTFNPFEPFEVSDEKGQDLLTRFPNGFAVINSPAPQAEPSGTRARPRRSKVK